MMFYNRRRNIFIIKQSLQLASINFYYVDARTNKKAS